MELNRMTVEDELKDAHILVLANKQVRTPPLQLASATHILRSHRTSPTPWIVA